MFSRFASNIRNTKEKYIEQFLTSQYFLCVVTESVCLIKSVDIIISNHTNIHLYTHSHLFNELYFTNSREGNSREFTKIYLFLDDNFSNFFQ